MTDSERYQHMAQFADIAASTFSGFSTHLGIYLTLLFAYCVVAYTAGSKLTRFQVILVSVMFFFAAELQTVIMTAMAEASRDAAAFGRIFLPEDAPIDALSRMGTEAGYFDEASIVGRLLWQLGIFAALLFMWNVRHSKAE